MGIPWNIEAYPWRRPCLGARRSPASSWNPTPAGTVVSAEGVDNRAVSAADRRNPRAGATRWESPLPHRRTARTFGRGQGQEPPSNDSRAWFPSCVTGSSLLGRYVFFLFFFCFSFCFIFFPSYFFLFSFLFFSSSTRCYLIFFFLFLFSLYIFYLICFLFFLISYILVSLFCFIIFFLFLSFFLFLFFLSLCFFFFFFFLMFSIYIFFLLVLFTLVNCFVFHVYFFIFLFS